MCTEKSAYKEPVDHELPVTGTDFHSPFTKELVYSTSIINSGYKKHILLLY